jgi:tetratricopeptide (TPR) repeat protein
MGYCRRKLGRYAEAEATYLEMLELAPTAESHFLVAQFYEDTQQTAKAREHARKAMALAPDRYDDVGRRLINKLSVYHFGCLGVYDVEKKHASGSPP